MNLLEYASIGLGCNCGCAKCKDMAGTGQTNVEMSFARPSSRYTRAVALGEDGVSVRSLVEGDYPIKAPQVVLRSKPDASSPMVAVLRRGEMVHAWGEMEIDPEHVFGPNNEAIPNPGDSLGIAYAHVGTEHGAGWVAVEFIDTTGTPATREIDEVDSTEEATSKSSAMPIVIGVLAGAAVLGAIALAVRQGKAERRAYA